MRAWDRTAARVPAEPEAAASPAEAVRGVDVVLTMLADGPAVEDVVEDARTAAGTLWLQMSTVGVEAAERLAELARRRGLTYVDAPVMGSRPQAEAGELVVLAAAPEAVREACAPLFEAIARKVLWLDGACEGSRLKVVLNGWILCSVESLAEALALARSLGLDPRRFFEGIEGMPFDMAYAHLKGALMVQAEYPASFPLRLARKDLALAADSADAGELEAPVLRAALAQFERALDLGAGDEDAAAVARASGLGST